ncbi:MAG: hypothetical protein ACREQ2_00200 [Candidatus Binatia bacterium]
MKILVLNCGSSTLKFKLIETDPASGSVSRERKLAGGLVDRIGGDASYRFEAAGRDAAENSAAIHDHDQAVRTVIEWLSSIAELGRPDAVGHRVVHGGGRFACVSVIVVSAIFVVRHFTCSEKSSQIAQMLLPLGLKTGFPRAKTPRSQSHQGSSHRARPTISASQRKPTAS